MVKSYIWTFVNRFVHVLLITLLALAYLSSDFDSLLYYHALFGVLFGVVVFFRIIWGFVGTRYSLFKDFNFKGVKEYLISILKDKKKFTGHNPASSIAIISMLVLGILIFITGMMTLGVEEKAGFFANLHFGYGYKFFKHLHEFFVNIFVFIAIVHIIGVLIDKFYNKCDALDSIIYGYKTTQKDESVSLNIFQKLLFAIFLISLIVLFFYLLDPNNKIIGLDQNSTFVSNFLYQQ
ncbi:cytochrome b/b6 domain-containing protein [Campylobacter volucris]|uniref:cytochrome b/b6 domain-containing protein n=1 Tax=Campylobacter volucris TaxID=1031542 RepID=UPI00189E15AC|nr:cytochrome b/b6 domain-containing protein [Campylobacter volucris]MBF7067376.1 cytochrome b/b6 domain-containing protein [Campylobacter volucris]